MNWKFWRRAARERDLDDEIAFDLAAESEERARSGMTRQEAELASRRDFGGVLLAKESTRETWGWGPVERFLQDARYALRQLARSPGFTLVAVASLALGIGANTAIFTLINLVMLKSLPVPHPEQLARIKFSPPAGAKSGLNQALWEQLRKRQDVFSGLFAYGSTGGADLSLGGEARPVSVGLVTGGAFATLGVRMAAGRTITDADDRPGCAGVAVLTYSFWKSEYGGRQDILGQSLTLNGHPLEIVGVTEPGFFGIEYGYHAPVWAPMCAVAAFRPGSPWYGGSIIGRAKPGVSIDQIRARIAVLRPLVLEASAPSDLPARAATQYRQMGLSVASFAKGDPFLREMFGDALLFLMAGVAVVLLIACANLANLLLARATARRGEMALRVALGAGRFRIVRQLLTESLTLSVAGAGLGILFSRWASAAFVTLLSRPGQVVLDLTPDLNVLAFSIAASLVTGVLFGLAPAWRASRVDLHDAMKRGGRGGVHAGVRLRGGRILVAGQVALSLVLVAGAALLAGSWLRAAAIDPGFRSAGVLITNVRARAAQFPPDRRAAIFAQIQDRLRAIPSVTSAAIASRTPFTSNNLMISVARPSPAADTMMVQANSVGADYFSVMRIPLVAGRGFGDAESPGSPSVVVVSEALARRLFGRSNAVGERLRMRAGRDWSEPIEIAGVVANSKEFSLRESDYPVIYMPFLRNQDPETNTSFALRTAGSPTALIPAVKEAIAAVDPRLSLQFSTLQANIDESLRLPRALGVLSICFGALALALASIGLYAVVAYMMAGRRGEIGVRMALGASSGSILRMALADIGRTLAAGLAAGVVTSLAVARLIAQFLYGVEPNDPATLGAAAVLLCVVAGVAAGLPARRASRLDPLAALREE